MDLPIIIDSLAEFYTSEEIRAIWKQILDATTSRAQLPIHINSRSRDGASSAGIVLSSIAECTAFMAACKAAIARLEGTTSVNADTLGTTVNFAYSTVQA